MNGPLAMLMVVLIIVLGIGAAWAITANGAATGSAVSDSFGQMPPNNTMIQNNKSAALAVSLMPIGTFAFIIAVCVVLVIAIVWFWNNGRNTKGKY
jgi:hypothetical protein